MAGFIPKSKMGKKARKQLDAKQRATWSFPPITKSVDSRKRYNRKKKPHVRDYDSGVGFFHAELSESPATLLPDEAAARRLLASPRPVIFARTFCNRPFPVC